MTMGQLPGYAGPNMDAAFWTEERIAGGVLVASLLVLLLAAVILFASGAISGFGAMTSGALAEAAPYASRFRPQIYLFALGWIVQLLGLSLLTRLLVRAGAGQLAIPAFTLVLIAVIAAFLYYTFRASVELWAAQEAARTGSAPEFFEPLRLWLSGNFRVMYRAHFLAMLGFGAAILQTELLSPELGWATIGWSALWFTASLVGAGLPALPFIMPVVIGVALLRA